MKQTILWTVLPYGVRNRTLSFTVFVTPRLDPDAPASTSTPQLQQFADFLDWPKTISSVRFDLRAGNQRIATNLPVTGMDQLNQRRADWQALFPPSLWVEPYEFQDYGPRPVRSYPAGQLEQQLLSRYKNLANLNFNSVTDPKQTRSKDKALAAFSGAHIDEQTKTELRSTINSILSGQKVITACGEPLS